MKTARTIGLVLSLGYEVAEAADLLGLDPDTARQQVAERKDELEQLAGLERSGHRCSRCGSVASRRIGELCVPCARSRVCRGCRVYQPIPVGNLGYCASCGPDCIHDCDGCGKRTAIRRSGLCCRCEDGKKARERERADNGSQRVGPDVVSPNSRSEQDGQ